MVRVECGLDLVVRVESVPVCFFDGPKVADLAGGFRHVAEFNYALLEPVDRLKARVVLWEQPPRHRIQRPVVWLHP